MIVAGDSVVIVNHTFCNNEAFLNGKRAIVIGNTFNTYTHEIWNIKLDDTDEIDLEIKKATRFYDELIDSFRLYIHEFLLINPGNIIE